MRQVKAAPRGIARCILHPLEQKKHMYEMDEDKGKTTFEGVRCTEGEERRELAQAELMGGGAQRLKPRGRQPSLETPDDGSKERKRSRWQRGKEEGMKRDKSSRGSPQDRGMHPTPSQAEVMR